MRRILVTGFEPFQGDPSNPSWTVAESLSGDQVGSCAVVAGRLPVDGARVGETLERLFKHHAPSAVLMLGLSQRPQISIERIAVNALDYRVPDNAGQIRSGAVVEGGPDGIFSSLPVAAILETWRASTIPAQLSDTAGTYLCNQAFYLMRHLHPETMAGFVHLPPRRVAGVHAARGLCADQGTNQRRAGRAARHRQSARGHETSPSRLSP